MAIQIDYFITASEEEAAATTRMEAGPRSEWSDVVPSSEVDPGLALGYLAEVLNGTALEDFLDEQGPAYIAASEAEAQVVLEIDPTFVRDVAALQAPFTDVAERWAAVTAPPQADDWEPRVLDLVEFLEGFTALARRSVDGEGAVYCWLWP